jgi:hypothetical protein
VKRPGVASEARQGAASKAGRTPGVYRCPFFLDSPYRISSASTTYMHTCLPLTARRQAAGCFWEVYGPEGWEMCSRKRKQTPTKLRVTEYNQDGGSGCDGNVSTRSRMPKQSAKHESCSLLDQLAIHLICMVHYDVSSLNQNDF